jgi:uncharacterized membrane protein YphA (DoxX/SURF4 family)
LRCKQIPFNEIFYPRKIIAFSLVRLKLASAITSKQIANNSRIMKKREIIVEVICFLFILLFVYASISKLLEYEKFSVQIGQSPMLTGLAGSIPWLVITVELLVSILLMIPKFRLVALFGAFCLMTMFTTYIVAILNFSNYIPCSCGGILEKLGWTEHLVFNVAFIALAVLGIVLATYQESPKEVKSREISMEKGEIAATQA